MKHSLYGTVSLCVSEGIGLTPLGGLTIIYTHITVTQHPSATDTAAEGGKEFCTGPGEGKRNSLPVPSAQRL